MDDLENQRLFDVANVTFGHPFSSSEFNNDKRGLPLIRIRDLGADEVTLYTTQRDYPPSAEVRTGDLLVGMDAEFSPYLWRLGRSLLNQRVCRIEPNSNLESDRVYLRAALLQPLTELQNSKSATTVIHLNKSDLERIHVRWPQPSQRAVIASILGALDDKIELNRRMNTTLEAMARALFQSWFVDFDPVRAKAEGRQPVGMDAETAALFPDSFEDSALGPIPTGWEVGPVESICSEITSGGTPTRKVKSNWQPAEIPWFKTGELHDGPLLKSEELISKEGLSDSACKIWPTGTILFALYASPTVGRMGVLTEPGTANQAAAALVARSDFGTPFLMGSLFSARLALQRYAVGAAQQNINQGLLKKHLIVVPPQTVAAAYSAIASKFYGGQVNVAKQNDSLSDLRDALLPKLVKGEIRVGDVAA